MADYVPGMGDLIWVNSPQLGLEHAGRRPSVVLSPRLYKSLDWRLRQAQRAGKIPAAVLEQVSEIIASLLQLP